MATRLTRAELHALVWDRPMTKLAKEFSLSDVALHKICRKHCIPTPPVGYWAKKAHGKPVKVTPLPTDKASGSSDTALVIHEGAATSESEAMSVARAQALSALPERSAPDQPVSAAITRTIEKLSKARPDRLGLVNVSGSRLITASMRPDSVERARKVLEALDAAAQAAGFSLGHDGDRAAWLAHGEHVGFEIAEVADRHEHTPTEAELQSVAKWEAEEEARFKRYGYRSGYGRPLIPKWEQRFEGRLAVRLEEVRIRTEAQYWGPTVPRTFTDTKTRDLLNMIPRIVSTIAAIAVAKRGTGKPTSGGEWPSRRRRSSGRSRSAAPGSSGSGSSCSITSSMSTATSRGWRGSSLHTGRHRSNLPVFRARFVFRRGLRNASLDCAQASLKARSKSAWRAHRYLKRIRRTRARAIRVGCFGLTPARARRESFLSIGAYPAADGAVACAIAWREAPAAKSRMRATM